MINRVTITGADNSIMPFELIQLSKQYPFVEWGILVSPKSTGNRSRFPSLDWIKELVDLKARAEHTGNQVNLSLHLCGGYVNDILMGDFISVYNEIHSIWNHFDRVQINTHGEKHQYSQLGLKHILEWFNEKEFIFQNDGTNGDVMSYLLIEKIQNFSALFDMSHGAGILPEKWEKPLVGIKCGYAGGIGPENIIEQCQIISDISDANPVPAWIDMETKIMTLMTGVNPGEPMEYEVFDLDKVTTCLYRAQLFVK